MPLDRETVDWSALEHAYGPASDVPPLLDDVAAGKARAVDQLANLLAHQGWCSPVAARATTPFLLELAERATGATLAQLVVLLADLACGGSHDHFLGTGVADPEHRLMLDDPDVSAMRAEIAAVPAANDWLNDRSAAVRSAAAMFVGATAHVGGVAMLDDRLKREKHAAVRADLLLALGWACTTGATLPPSVEDSTKSTNEHERACAWIATVLGGRFGSSEVSDLIDALGLAPLKGATFARGDVARVATEVMRVQAQRRNDLTALLTAFEHLDDTARGRFGGTLVKQLFRKELAALGRGNAEARPPLESLSAEQKALLELLCRFDAGWGGSSDQGYNLRKLGLPASPPNMLVYLGHPREPDLLDRAFSYGGRSGSVREVLSAVCTKDGLSEAPDVARALAAIFSVEETPDVVDLGGRLVVPWGWTWNAIALHLLVERGADLLPFAQAKLAHCIRHGPPQFWDSRDLRRIGANLPIFLWTAIRALDPTAQRPKNLRFDSNVVDMMQRNGPGNLTEAAVGWLAAVLGP